MRKQDLSNYKLPLNWERGNNVIFEAIWVVLFRPIVSSFLPGSSWRKIILIIFGAKIGKNIRFNYGLKVKFPEIARAVTNSGEATNACVLGLPSARFAKLRLNE